MNRRAFFLQAAALSTAAADYSPAQVSSVTARFANAKTEAPPVGSPKPAKQGCVSIEQGVGFDAESEEPRAQRSRWHGLLDEILDGGDLDMLRCLTLHLEVYRNMIGIQPTPALLPAAALSALPADAGGRVGSDGLAFAAKGAMAQ